MPAPHNATTVTASAVIMPSITGLRGLYAIADTGVLAPRHFETAVTAALAGGARMVQYRDKSGDHARRSAEAAILVALCREHGAISIINDDAGLALAVGADGVHVGRDDDDPAAARERLGRDHVLGISCYNDLARAHEAIALGADYVAFGSVFPSSTKPDAVHAPLELFARARDELDVPLCAIGGITADNAAQVFSAGADLVAVIRDLFQAEDVRARAARIAACAG